MTRHPLSAMTDEEIREGVALYAEGKPIDWIAQWFGCARSTAWRNLRRAGVKFREQGKPAYEFGGDLGTAPDPEIAARYGCSICTVQKGRKRRGIPAFKASP